MFWHPLVAEGARKHHSVFHQLFQDKLSLLTNQYRALLLKAST